LTANNILRFRGASTTTLIVGIEREYFYVHQNRLEAASVWFTKALSNGLEETTTRQIMLPEDDPEIVHLFVQWLYNPDPIFSAFINEHFLQLAQLFEFAERLLIWRLKNYIVWQLFDLRTKSHTPPLPTIEFAFDRLPDESPFRKLLVAWYCWHQESALSLTLDALNIVPQFSSALSMAMIKRRFTNMEDPFSKDPDVYYDRGDMDVEAAVVSPEPADAFPEALGVSAPDVPGEPADDSLVPAEDNYL
jgi:hypothetical protein